MGTSLHLPGRLRRKAMSANWRRKSLGSAKEIGPLLDRLLATLKRRRYGAQDLFSVRLAVEEALVNAFKHGHHNLPGKAVTVRFRIAPDEVLVEVEDQGPGFDPAQVPDPLAAENLERGSGRGLFLMRSYMSLLSYNERGNRVSLCRRRTGR